MEYHEWKDELDHCVESTVPFPKSFLNPSRSHPTVKLPDFPSRYSSTINDLFTDRKGRGHVHRDPFWYPLLPVPGLPSVSIRVESDSYVNLNDRLPSLPLLYV